MGRVTAAVLVALVTGILAISAPAGAQVGSATCAGANTAPSLTSTDALASTMRCLINAERGAGGLRSLSSSSILGASATRQLRDVLDNSFLDHIGTDGSTIVSRTKDAGFINKKLKRWTVGEILAYGQENAGTPASIITAWMNSPTHRNVIMHANFKNIAIAVGRGTTVPGGATDASAATYGGVFGYKKNK